MSFIKKAGSFLGSGLLGIAGNLLFGKKPKQQALPKPVTRDDAREATEADDELRRRRGGSADIVAGSGSGGSGVGIGRLVAGS